MQGATFFRTLSGSQITRQVAYTSDLILPRPAGHAFRSSGRSSPLCCYAQHRDLVLLRRVEVNRGLVEAVTKQFIQAAWRQPIRWILEAVQMLAGPARFVPGLHHPIWACRFEAA